MNDDRRYDDRNRNSAARDQAAGTMRQAGGRVEESMGALSGNERLRAQGLNDQAAGSARRKKGQWKQRLMSWINRA
jgi:uncharacterized protein YjbJ (UPF0337 family)